MVTSWVGKIGPYRVEKKESPRPVGPYLKLDSNPSFCVHTTEGTTVAGAWNTLDSQGFAPHFIVGEDRIVQMRPLWAQGATLRAHNEEYIQVECVGFSKLTEHKLTPETWDPLVYLSWYVTEVEGVPPYRPPEWPDSLGGGTWANDNNRRQDGYALSRRGIYGHVDVPDQSPTWHWDPGSLNYSELLKQAKEIEDNMGYAEFKEGVKRRLEKKPIPVAEGDERFGWKFADWAGENPLPDAHTHKIYSPAIHKHAVIGEAK
jgi:hypothetical protein